MRYLIKFSYDGSNFSGYQRQFGLRTVEECFNKALYDINNHKDTIIYSSGRTDARVHALEQTAHFDLDIKITLFKLKCALNSLLPSDIHVFSTEIVDKDFHARYNVKTKIYEYLLNEGEYAPIDRNYVYQYNKKLDINKMNEAIEYFVGKHDFKNYVSRESVKNDYIRTIYNASIKRNENIVKFTFEGTGFMKYQVRNMVGTLIKVGSGKLLPGDVKKILENEKYINKVLTINPEGLYLKKVNY